MAYSMDGNQASFGSKRSQNDVSRRDGDWICAACGNLNFSFRAVCYQRHCNAQRPFVNLANQVMSPNRNNYPQFYHECVVTPPPLYGIPCIFILPISHSSLQNYNGFYSGPHASYRLVPFIPLESIGGTHTGVASPMPEINPYCYSFQGPPPRDEGVIIDNLVSQKRHRGPDGLSEGDWICPKCKYVNFAFRTKCKIKRCGAAKPGPSQPDRRSVPPKGSWTCKKCGYLNYPFRTVCNMKGCRIEKTASSN